MRKQKAGDQPNDGADDGKSLYKNLSKHFSMRKKTTDKDKKTSLDRRNSINPVLRSNENTDFDKNFYKTNLEYILYHDDFRLRFIRWSRKKLQDEEPRFLDAVVQFKKEKAKKTRIAIAHDIIFEFILPDSPKEISISPKLKDHFESLVDDYYKLSLPNVFALAEDEVKKTLQFSPTVREFLIANAKEIEKRRAAKKRLEKKLSKKGSVMRINA